MSPSEIQPELIRRPVSLPALRRLAPPQYSARDVSRDSTTGQARDHMAHMPDAQPANSVRRRADLDHEPATPKPDHTKTLRIPNLLAGTQTNGRQATAGSERRSDLDNAFELLERTVVNQHARRNDELEVERSDHMLHLRAELTRSQNQSHPLSPGKLESASSTVSSGGTYSRAAGIVAPNGKRAQVNMPSIQFSRRSTPAIVPDVETVPPVFMSRSGRDATAPASSRAPSNPHARTSASADGAERRLAATTAAAAIRERTSTPRRRADGEDRTYEGWASDW